MEKKESCNIKEIKEFVEKFDNMKKVNPKDLSSDQDLSIAIMNLISIEEHLIFSGAKTGKTYFYDLVAEARDMRKCLMQKMITEYEGEVWCISKHLLGASYRLMEVGTKQQSLGNTKEAYDLFDKAYELYCMFWGLNMKLIDPKNMKWIKDTGTDIKEIKNYVASYEEKTQKKTIKKEETKQNKTNAISKIKDMVKKAVNCCIE